MRNILSRKGLLRVLVASAIVPPAVSAQVAYYQTPLDVPSDARGVGMGESLVALRGNSSALVYNPAGLASLVGAGFSYSERELNWMPGLEDFRYYGFNGWVETPVGVFAARYDRFSMGTINGALQADNAQGYVDVNITPYKHDIILGFGREIGGGLEAGVSAKYYDDVTDYAPGTESEFPSGTPSTTPAWLFDGGLLYTVPGLPGRGSALEELTIALSLQNVGTKIKYAWGGLSSPSEQALPEYFRAGLALKAALPGSGSPGPELLAMAFTLEYSNLLNTSPDRIGGTAFWGSGLELTLGGIVTLRGGCVVLPVTSAYGEAGAVAYRYGLGVNFPLRRMGIPVPLVIEAGYAAIPLRDMAMLFFGPQRHSLDSFTFEVRME